MADAVEALRVAILFVGWPGMAVVSAYVLLSSWQFQERVKGSPFGRLVFLMVAGWTLTLCFLAFLGTLYVQQDPTGAGPWAAGLLVFWAVTMAVIVWTVTRWGGEAVHINLYYAELAALDRVKSQLINTVAHELKTPLTPVLLTFHMLRQEKYGPLSDGQKTAIASIERSLGRLQILIDQVVLATQIQTGRLQLDAHPWPVAECVADAVGPFLDKAKADGRAIRVKVSPSTLAFDRPRVQRVLVSLLDNAVRFSKPTDAIDVHAGPRWDDSLGTDAFVVEVVDHGSGISAEQQSVLFQPFRQSTAGQATGSEGAGLGLYLARGIVEAHGGRMWVTSGGAGKGTTAGFALPLNGVRPLPTPGAAPTGSWSPR